MLSAQEKKTVSHKRYISLDKAKATKAGNGGWWSYKQKDDVIYEQLLINESCAHFEDLKSFNGIQTIACMQACMRKETSCQNC